MPPTLLLSALLSVAACTPDLDLATCYPGDGCDAGSGPAGGRGGSGGEGVGGDDHRGGDGGHGGATGGAVVLQADAAPGGADSGPASQPPDAAGVLDDLKCCTYARCLESCGECEPEGGALRFAFVVDLGADVLSDAPPGVDLCGVSAQCGDETIAPINIIVSPGMGDRCGDPNNDCTPDRTDTSTALDNGASCSLVNDPSDFVALGWGGTASIEFDRDLQGCQVRFSILDDPFETYEIYVCADAARASCAANGEPLNCIFDDTGPTSVTVPEAGGCSPRIDSCRSSCTLSPLCLASSCGACPETVGEECQGT